MRKTVCTVSRIHNPDKEYMIVSEDGPPAPAFLARLASVVTTLSHVVLGGHMVGIDMDSAVSPPAGFQLEVTVFHWG